ncbi:hypothetical protein IE53DRAFT_368172 [Violaceomyces palustris]|uniref:Uncharacterized protein n=1 Tax=Violaceomyces palustris TaxID=1673888 RepID=A0ACD0NZQ1_9BASI|nr:hypothetical protein IE53DRAFT_368172 [Violaceomyces palustris]
MSAEFDAEESCRICRSGPEPSSPLYHPCKCSGSIRYCHQDCLVEWLRHSKKKYCELCQHPFIFNKKYRGDMPTGKLPTHLYLRRLLLQSGLAIKLTLRAILVAITWLAFLPWVNITLWRTYFWASDLVSSSILSDSGARDPRWNLINDTSWLQLLGEISKDFVESTTTGSDAASFSKRNANVSASTDSSLQPSILHMPDAKSWLTKLGHEIFEGQVLTCVLVVVFVGIFLLRELILQHVPQINAGLDPDPALQLQQPLADAAAPPPLPRPAFPFPADPNQALELAANARANVEARIQAQAQVAALRLRLAQMQEVQQNLHVDGGHQPRTDNDLLEAADVGHPGASPLPTALSDSPAKIYDQEVGQDFRTRMVREMERDRNRQEIDGLWSGIGIEAEDEEEDLPQTVEDLRLARMKRFAAGPEQEAVGFGNLNPPLGRSESNLRFTFDFEDSPKQDAGWGIETDLAVKQGEEFATGRLDKEITTSFDAEAAFSVQRSAPLETDFPRSTPIGMRLGESSNGKAKRWEADGSASPRFAHDDDEPIARRTRNQTRELGEPSSDERWRRAEPYPESSSNKGKARAVEVEGQPEDDDGIPKMEAWEDEFDSETEFDHPVGLWGKLEETKEERAGVDQGTQAYGPIVPIAQEPSGGTLVEGIENDATFSDTSDDTSEDEEDEEDEDGGRGEGEAGNNFNRIEGQGNRNPMEDLVGEGQDADLDAEGFNEEIEGIMEAVGMQGPIPAMFQNLAIMCVLCSTVLLVFVALPYLVGKLFGAGPRLVWFVGLPIKGLRWITDPVFDAAIWLVTSKIWPPLSRGIGEALGSGAAQKVASSQAQPSEGGPLNGFFRFAPWAGRYLDRAPAFVREQASAQGLDLDLKSGFAIAAQTGLRNGYDAAYQTLTGFFENVDAKTRGTSRNDRALTVALGYLYWLIFIGVQSNVGGLFKSDSVRWAKSVIDQQLLIIKVLVFIGIELVAFPLGCGILLDLCLMPLFPGATIGSRWTHFRYAPLTFSFCRWTGGTLYMFLFAQYVHSTRSIVRPGVLCWIRDPNDPGFHPIKEILDRKSLLQLRKIGTSALMYAGILIAAVGVNIYFVRFALRDILPLRWKPFTPISDVPVDLLVVHLIMPWISKKLKADKVAMDLSRKWWAFFCKEMRLSSYMLGGNHPEEEGKQVYRTWSAWILRKKVKAEASVGTDENEEVSFVKDGSYARVPADDKAIMSTPLIIPTDSSGTPIDQKGHEHLAKQVEAIEKILPASSKPTYMVVYLPPNFRQRVITLMVLLWLSNSIAMISLLSVPLVLGRCLLRLLSVAGEQHDSYSFTLGLGLLLFCLSCSIKFRKVVRRARSRSAASEAKFFRYLGIAAGRKVSRWSKLAYLGFAFGIVLPTLLGLTVNQYIVIPLRYPSNEVPEIHLAQIWATGLVELKLIVKLLRMFPVDATRPLVDAINETRNAGMRRCKPWSSTKRLILPTALALLALLIVPALAAKVSLQGRRNVTAEMEQVQLRMTYGLVLTTATALIASKIVSSQMDSWTGLLRDEIFLESTELKNYNPHGEAEEKGEEGGISTDGSRALVEEGPLPDVLI